MEKLTITKFVAKDKKKDGTKYVWPSGDEYTMLFLQTREHGDMWFSCAGQSWNKGWKTGDTIEVEVEHSADGKWHNLKKSDPMSELSKAVFRHEKEISELKKEVALLKTYMAPDREELPLPENTTSATEDDIELPF